MENMQDHSVREIYKYGWLRVISSEEKKVTSLPKKSWVVFCIHDENMPHLEVYSDKKVAIMHKPDACYVLTGVLHVSPTICPLEGEYEFVITRTADMMRFIAPSWNQMMNWIDNISSKLRELKILTPKENEYSAHLPEAKPALLPTRDPNSPLPLPPAVPSIPPGVELVNQSSALSESNNADEGQVPPSTSIPLISRLRLTPEQMTRQTVVVDIEGDNDVLSNYSSGRTVIEVPAQYLPFDMFDLNAITEVIRQLSNPSAVEIGTVNSTPSPTNPEPPVSRHSDNTVMSGNCTVTCVNTPDESARADIGEVASTPSTDSVPSTSASVITLSPNSPSASVIVNGIGNRSQHQVEDSVQGMPDVVPIPTSGIEAVQSELVDETTVPLQNGSFYEHVFLPSTSRCTPSVHHSSPSVPHLPRMGRGVGHVRSRRKNAVDNNHSSHAFVGADRIRAANISLTPSPKLHPPPHPFNWKVNSGVNDPSSNGSSNCLKTLREQQVIQLRREMSHPAGVRLQLRRKDCLNSIAFVDAFRTVWIAGWKQKEHPVLYNAFHIGDQLISIAGKLVYNASDAQKIIRAWPSLYIEFVIRRVPCGRVFALRREWEGQTLGIIQDGNSAEVKDIVPGSPAAAQGLLPRTPTMDGLSLTNWVLTEINGRPLNLFFKDGEIKDRLNAVGLDISLLVQPSDLIKQIKKQLKTIKNYKDYLLQ